MSRPYTYVGEYPAQNEHFGIYGIFAYRNREFWCKGYYVDTAGKNTKAIKEYIADQLKRDAESDQLSMFDPRNPFTGSK